MRRPRMTVASLLMFVAMLALCMAALFSAGGFWISVAATITLGVLLGAVLGAILLRGAERAFCLGFFLFAGVYLVLVDWDWVGGQFGHDLTLALSELAEWIHSEPAAVRSARTIPFLTQLPIELLQARQGKIGNFVEVGRMLLALLFGLLGGLIGGVLVSHRDRQGDGRPAPNGEASLPRE